MPFLDFIPLQFLLLLFLILILTMIVPFVFVLLLLHQFGDEASALTPALIWRQARPEISRTATNTGIRVLPSIHTSSTIPVFSRGSHVSDTLLCRNSFLYCGNTQGPSPKGNDRAWYQPSQHPRHVPLLSAILNANPQNNGNLERFHGNIKGECLRRGTTLALKDAAGFEGRHVEHCSQAQFQSGPVPRRRPPRCRAARQKYSSPVVMRWARYERTEGHCGVTRLQAVAGSSDTCCDV